MAGILKAVTGRAKPRPADWRPAGRARVDQLASQVQAELTATADEVAAMPAGTHAVLDDVMEAIHARCRTIQNTLAK